MEQKIKEEEPITRRESFAMIFGVLDVLVYIKPHLAKQAQETLMELYQLSFPNKGLEDYLNLSNMLHDEKTGAVKKKIDAIFRRNYNA